MEVLGFPIAQIDAMSVAAMNRVAEHIETIGVDVEAPLEDIEKFLTLIPGKRMLDLGCGWGYYVHRFSDAGLIHNGIDISPKMIELSRKRNPASQLVVSCMRTLPFADNSFDGVWSCCAMNHEPKAVIDLVLAEIRRVLVPGGILYVVLPDHEYSDQTISSPHSLIKEQTYIAYWEFLEFYQQALLWSELEPIDAFVRSDFGSMTFVARK